MNPPQCIPYAHFKSYFLLFVSWYYLPTGGEGRLTTLSLFFFFFLQKPAVSGTARLVVCGTKTEIIFTEAEWGSKDSDSILGE